MPKPGSEIETSLEVLRVLQPGLESPGSNHVAAFCDRSSQTTMKDSLPLDVTHPAVEAQTHQIRTSPEDTLAMKQRPRAALGGNSLKRSV